MNTIRVTNAYRGEEGFIPQGLYTLNDVQLLGLSEYLLSAGHAKLSNEMLESGEAITPQNDHELQLKVHAGRVVVEGGELVTTKLEPFVIGIDPATPGADATVAVLVELREDVPSLSDLRNRYKELAGKGASPKWDAETLESKIAELESAESDNA